MLIWRKPSSILWHVSIHGELWEQRVEKRKKNEEWKLKNKVIFDVCHYLWCTVWHEENVESWSNYYWQSWRIYLWHYILPLMVAFFFLPLMLFISLSFALIFHNFLFDFDADTTKSNFIIAERKYIIRVNPRIDESMNPSDSSDLEWAFNTFHKIYFLICFQIHISFFISFQVLFCLCSCLCVSRPVSMYLIQHSWIIIPQFVRTNKSSSLNWTKIWILMTSALCCVSGLLLISKLNNIIKTVEGKYVVEYTFHCCEKSILYSIELGIYQTVEIRKQKTCLRASDSQ